MATPKHTQDWRKRQTKSGNCPQCGNKNDNKDLSKRCSKCTAKARLDNQVRRNSRYSNGLCTNCGKRPYEKDKKRCAECCAKNREWYKQSGYREKNRIRDKQRRHNRRRKVVDHYGGKCACCGESKILFLSIDHINEDGAKHRAEIMGSPDGGRRIGSTIFYKWLEKNNFPEGFQVLCHNCNMGKHLNGGTCPHMSS